MMGRASGAFGIKVAEPLWVECPYFNKSEDYIKPILADIKPENTELVVIVLSRKELKAPIKKALVEMGCIS